MNVYELERLAITLQGDASRYTRTLDEAGAMTRTAAREIERAGAAAGRLAGDGLASGVRVGAASASEALQKAVGATQAAGAAMKAALTDPLTKVGSDAAKLSNDFELAMSRVEGLVGIAGDQVRAWSRELIALAPTLGKSPQELADALFYITSAGLRGKWAMDALLMSARASTAGLGSTQKVADAVTSAVNAYGRSGLTAAKATDVLTAAVREGKLEASALAPIMGRVLPIASAMGVGFADVAGAIAVMSRVGASAPEASVGVQAFLSGLRKPSDEGRRALESVGLSFEQLRNTVKESGGLVKAMRIVDAAFKGNDEAVSSIIPNIRALRAAMNVLSQDGAVVDGMLKGVRDSVGDTDKAFNVAAATSAVKLEAAMGALRGAMIQVGRAVSEAVTPVLVRLGEAAAAAGEWFAGLSPDMQRVVLLAAGIAASVGPALLAVAGAATAVSWALPGIGAVLAAIPAVGGAILAIPGLIAAAVPALPTLAVAAVALAAKLAVAAAAAALVGVAVAGVVALITGAVRRMGGWRAAWDEVRRRAEAAWLWLEPVREALASFWRQLLTTAAAAWRALEDAALSAWESIFGGASMDWSGFRDRATSAIYAAEYALANLRQTGELAWAGVQYATVRAGNEILHVLTRVIPYAAWWSGTRLLDALGEAWLAANELAVRSVLQTVAYLQSIDWYEVFVGLLRAAGDALGKLVAKLVTLQADLPAIMSGSKAFEFKVDLSRPREEAQRAAAQVEQAQKRTDEWRKSTAGLSRVWQALSGGKPGAEFTLPVRVEGEWEADLRRQFERLGGEFAAGAGALEATRRIEGEFDRLSARLADMLGVEFLDLDAMLSRTIDDAMSILDVGRWGTTLASEAGKVGTDVGKSFGKGVAGQVKGVEAAFRGSVEAAIRWAAYEESVLRPIAEARRERTRRQYEADVEAVRAERVRREQIRAAAPMYAARAAEEATLARREAARPAVSTPPQAGDVLPTTRVVESVLESIESHVFRATTTEIARETLGLPRADAAARADRLEPAPPVVRLAESSSRESIATRLESARSEVSELVRRAEVERAEAYRREVEEFRARIADGERVGVLQREAAEVATRIEATRTEGGDTATLERRASSVREELATLRERDRERTVSDLRREATRIEGQAGRQEATVAALVAEGYRVGAEPARRELDATLRELTAVLRRLADAAGAGRPRPDAPLEGPAKPAAGDPSRAEAAARRLRESEAAEVVLTQASALESLTRLSRPDAPSPAAARLATQALETARLRDEVTAAAGRSGEGRGPGRVVPPAPPALPDVEAAVSETVVDVLLAIPGVRLAAPPVSPDAPDAAPPLPQLPPPPALDLRPPQRRSALDAPADGRLAAAPMATGLTGMALTMQTLAVGSPVPPRPDDSSGPTLLPAMPPSAPPPDMPALIGPAAAAPVLPSMPPQVLAGPTTPTLIPIPSVKLLQMAQTVPAATVGFRESAPTLVPTPPTIGQAAPSGLVAPPSAPSPAVPTLMPPPVTVSAGTQAVPRSIEHYVQLNAPTVPRFVGQVRPTQAAPHIATATPHIGGVAPHIGVPLPTPMPPLQTVISGPAQAATQAVPPVASTPELPQTAPQPSAIPEMPAVQTPADAPTVPQLPPLTAPARGGVPALGGGVPALAGGVPTPPVSRVVAARPAPVPTFPATPAPPVAPAIRPATRDALGRPPAPPTAPAVPPVAQSLVSSESRESTTARFDAVRSEVAELVRRTEVEWFAAARLAVEGVTPAATTPARPDAPRQRPEPTGRAVERPEPPRADARRDAQDRSGELLRLILDELRAANRKPALRIQSAGLDD